MEKVDPHRFPITSSLLIGLDAKSDGIIGHSMACVDHVRGGGRSGAMLEHMRRAQRMYAARVACGWYPQ